MLLKCISIIILPTILATIFYRYLSYRQNKELGEVAASPDKIVNAIRSTAFYGYLFYLIMCLLRVVVGHGTKSLSGSYDAITRSTYIHYIPVLCVLAIVIPIVFSLVIKTRYREGFILQFVSVMTVLGSVKIICSSYVSTLESVIIAVIAVAISFLTMKKQVEVSVKMVDIKQRLLVGVPVILFVVVTAVIYLPATLYMQNTKDMKLPPHVVFGTIIGSGILILALVTFSYLFLVTKNQFRLWMAFIWGTSFMGYLQVNFLNRDMKSMDGYLQSWNPTLVLVNGIIWIVVLIAVMLLCLKWKDSFGKIIAGLSLALCAMQLVSLLVFLLTGSLKWDKNNEYYASTEHILEMDDENNVVFIIMDWMDEKIAERLQAENVGFFEPFADFTWYQNATSKYTFTYPSLTYMMTGVEKPADVAEEEYGAYAFECGDFTDKILGKNYDITMATNTNYIYQNVYHQVSNFKSRQNTKYNHTKLFYLMTRCSRYSMAPFCFKNNFFYWSGDFIKASRANDEYVLDEDGRFYSQLMNEGMRVVDKSAEGIDGGYRLYHLYGAHAPFSMNENMQTVRAEDTTRMKQAQGAFKIVFEMMKQMKDLGIYDNATIIILGDHGQNTYFNDPEGAAKEQLNTASTPILFVKMPGQKQSEIVTSGAPVSHEQVLPTVLKSIGYDVNAETFEDIAEEDARARYTVIGRDPDIPYTMYEITGDAKDEKNWLQKAYAAE